MRQTRSTTSDPPKESETTSSSSSSSDSNFETTSPSETASLSPDMQLMLQALTTMKTELNSQLNVLNQRLDSIKKKTEEASSSSNQKFENFKNFITENKTTTATIVKDLASLSTTVTAQKETTVNLSDFSSLCDKQKSTDSQISKFQNEISSATSELTAAKLIVDESREQNLRRITAIEQKLTSHQHKNKIELQNVSENINKNVNEKVQLTKLI